MNDFKDKGSFPEYHAIFTDSTSVNDEKFKNKKDGKVMQYHFIKSDPGKLFFKYHYSAIGIIQLFIRKFQLEIQVKF